MAIDPEIQASTNAEETGDGWDRRRLLKAAAAAAPIIATLPSGAALANASAQQCVTTSRDESNNLTDGAGGDWIEPDNNPFVRWTAKFIKKKITYRPVPTINFTLVAKRGYYVIDFDSQLLHYAGDYVLGDSWNDVPEHVPGKQFNTPSPPSGYPAGETDPGDPIDVSWVDQWEADGDPEFRNVLVTFVETGDGPLPTRGVHFTGFYPNKMRGDTAFEDNMGITSSCLCSVDPNFRELFC